MQYEQALVFIDAGYLAKISKRFGRGKYLNVDPIKFGHYLAIKQGYYCEHVYYYTAPPFQSTQPTKKEARMKSGYDSFTDKLKKSKQITVREGRVQKIGRKYTQKGVDTLVTIDLCQEPPTEKN